MVMRTTSTSGRMSRWCVLHDSPVEISRRMYPSTLRAADVPHLARLFGVQVLSLAADEAQVTSTTSTTTTSDGANDTSDEENDEDAWPLEMMLE